MSKFKQAMTIDRLVTHGTAVCRITHSDLTDADGSQSFTWNSLSVGKGEALFPAKSKVMAAWANVLVPFAGGSASAVTLSLGDAGSATELMNAQSVFTGVSGLVFGNGSYAKGTYESAYAPIIKVDVTDDTCANLTAGIMEICIQYETIGTQSVTS